MTANPSTARDRPSTEPGRGMALMAGAMILVPCMDAIAKVLSSDLAPFQVTFLRFLVQSLALSGVLLLVARRGGPWHVPREAVPKIALAGLLVGLAVAFIYWAVGTMPLANVIAIFFVEPLVLTLFSAVFLGERVGWHRLGAVAAGLVGALIIIRPNWAMFGWVSVLPLLAAVCFAGQLTVIRSITATLDGLRVHSWSGAFALLFLGVGLLVGGALGLPGTEWRPLRPDTTIWSLVIAVGLLSAVSHLMITVAFRISQASLLAPFQYLEIFGATVLGYVLFDDFPDALTWLGTAIILGAGFYVIYRERRLGRVPRVPPPTA